MGVFAQWQPAYAEAGIATFPVDADLKKPAVGNPLKGGRNASALWAAKFPEANALGFACGARSGVTVVDIDEPGERPVADVIAKLGPTPLVVRTASGKHHLWYRHSGEPRSPRKLAREMGLAGPIDILGERGFAIAPPSQKGGGVYEWAQGSLADLSSLPAMRKPTPTPVTAAGVSGSELVREGERNPALFQWCMQQARSAGSLAVLVERSLELNASEMAVPLPEGEARAVAVKAWGYQESGQNWFGIGRQVAMSHTELDAVFELGPDAFTLCLYLHRHHWGRDFFVANALAGCMPGGSWSLKRFAAARKRLLDAGEIIELRPPSAKHGPALYRFGENRPAGVRGGAGGGG